MASNQKKGKIPTEDETNALKSQELLLYLLSAADSIFTVNPGDIPDINLYMDQVTTFMDEHLGESRRRDGDKILTKTMINNYAKNSLLPPPEKKKYSKEHICLLIFIYYYKGFLSLTDIQSILRPLTEDFFHREDGRDISTIYTEITRMTAERMKDFREEVNDMEDLAADYFTDVPEGEDRDFLRIFSLINMLAYDVYVRKSLIEKLIDRYFPEETDEKRKAQKRK